MSAPTLTAPVQKPATTINLPAPALAPARAGLLQRKCACGGSTGTDGECEECKQKKMSLQRSAGAPAGSNIAPPIVRSVLGSPGRPLSLSDRAYFEPRLGHDFSRVKIHDDEKSAESARAVAAHAYTVGNSVVFGAGRFAPGSTAGRRLLAHELAHVVQQRSASTDGDLQIGPETDVYERAADAIADQIAYPTAAHGPMADRPPVSAGRFSVQRESTGPAPSTGAESASPSSGAPAAKQSCPALPSGIPGTCPDRHNGYAAAAGCFRLNSWLPCASVASNDVCRAVDAFNFTGNEGLELEACVLASRGDKRLTRAKAAWFNNTNSCIWGHWRAAFDALHDPALPVPTGLTPEWAAAVTTCRADGIGTDTCCRAHVVAEQHAIEACGSYDSDIFGKLPTDVPGSKTCSDLVLLATPGLPFTGDFSKVGDRITYGVLRCCSGL
jgi:hypothetical protein